MKPPFHSLAVALAGVLALVVCAPATARAEIVKLANGRIMTVESARYEGDMVVLLMRGGGEIRTAKSEVAELLPDEVPYARAVALEALAASPLVNTPRMAPEAVANLVNQIAARVGIDAKLVHAVIRAESNYDPRAISPKGAMGLMQLMPIVAREYRLTDPFDPAGNLEAGMRHLQSLLKRFDVSRAVAAYNAGASAVVRYGGVPPYRETQQYVQRVMAQFRR